VELLAPPTARPSVCYASWMRRLNFAHYDAYEIASTGYAASYVPPTGALLMGQEKTPLGQRVSSVSEKIFSNTVAIKVLCAVYCTITLGPPVGASASYVSAPLGL